MKYIRKYKSIDVYLIFVDSFNYHILPIFYKTFEYICSTYNLCIKEKNLQKFSSTWPYYSLFIINNLIA